MHITPVELIGQHAKLTPLKQAHLEDLQAAALDGKLWELFFTFVPNPETTQQWLDTALSLQDKGSVLAFTVIQQSTGKIIGSTRYCRIAPEHKRLEIGYTWYSQSAQRSAINTECKLLLLTHAFEVLDCNVVELRTDWFNKKSQAAIERLGAKRDGVLRNHILSTDGRVRDIVVYSILKSEWMGVKNNLEFLLKRRRER
ncbi:MAG: GNAT family N-acetyltransferase [Undibacterium sp.]|nr:GNAT family N-acetyltransferase [Undibacterium sp.]